MSMGDERCGPLWRNENEFGRPSMSMNIMVTCRRKDNGNTNKEAMMNCNVRIAMVLFVIISFATVSFANDWISDDILTRGAEPAATDYSPNPKGKLVVPKVWAAIGNLMPYSSTYLNDWVPEDMIRSIMDIVVQTQVRFPQGR
jgi:hypothetical protein